MYCCFNFAHVGIQMFSFYGKKNMHIVISFLFVLTILKLKHKEKREKKKFSNSFIHFVAVLIEYMT
jgi:hypothetical protein